MRKVWLHIAFCFLMLVSSSVTAQGLSVEPISLEQALKLAPEQGKKILVDVFATWCPYCQRMHDEVYPSESVQQAISDHFIWVMIDVDSDNMVNYHGEQMTEAEFANALSNKNVPTVYFLDDEGAILGTQPGYLKEDVFANLLNFVGSDAYLNQSFHEYTRSDE